MSKVKKARDVVASYLVEKLRDPSQSGWRRISLADVGRWSGGGTPSKENLAFWTSGTIPWVSPKDMKVNRIHETQDYITESAVENSATNVVRKGAVLVVARSGILRHSLPVAIADRDVTINQDLKAVELTEGLVPDYLAWALRAYARDILHRCAKTGTTVQNLDFPAFLRYEIPVAPLNEQRRIVAEIEEQLTRLEAGIAALKRAQANLKRYRASVIQAACNGTLVPGAKIGDGWRTVSLGDLAKSSSYGTSVKCSYENSGIAVLRIPNVSNGRIELKDMKRAPEAYSVAKEDYLAPGDVLIIRTNGSKNLIGRGAIVLENSPFPVTYASYLIRFRLHEGPILWKWVSLALEYSGTRQWIEEHAASSAGQHNVSLSLLKTMPIPLPSENDQRRLLSEVDRCLSVIEEVETTVAGNLKRGDKLRFGILSGAFTFTE